MYSPVHRLKRYIHVLSKPSDAHKSSVFVLVKFRRLVRGSDGVVMVRGWKQRECWIYEGCEGGVSKRWSREVCNKRGLTVISIRGMAWSDGCPSPRRAYRTVCKYGMKYRYRRRRPCEAAEFEAGVRVSNANRIFMLPIKTRHASSTVQWMRGVHSSINVRIRWRLS